MTMRWALAFVLGTVDGLAVAPKNTALVFLKPHAASPQCEKYVRSRLEDAGLRVLATGLKKGAEIEALKLIDQHYGSLAKLAMDTEPADIALQPASKADFAEAYGVEWDDALPSMLRNDAALEALGVDGCALEGMWRSGVQVKLAPGTYVSRLEQADASREQLFTINGFYPAMRQAFVEPSASVRYMVCEWDEGELSWSAFRQQVIGATDPAKARAGSLRAELLARWQELGLAGAPTQGLNGVHASAGPLEGLKERCVWASASVEGDPLGQSLLEGGLELRTLQSWLEDNPVVTLDGKTDKVFDLTEEMGTAAVLEIVRASCGATPTAAAAAPGGEDPSGRPPTAFVWGRLY